MRMIMLLAVAFLTFNAYADVSTPAPVKTCTTVLVSLDEGKPDVPTVVEIFTDSANVSKAKVTQTIEGKVSSYEDTVQITQGKVRPGLTSNSELEDLNLQETLVVHAMDVTEDPVFGGKLQAGLDLKKVRFAIVYQVGKSEGMGMTAIVEAKDEQGKPLGSFLGGFLVTPCK